MTKSSPGDDTESSQGQAPNEWEKLAFKKAAEGETWRIITDELKNYGADAQTAEVIAKRATKRPTLIRIMRIFALAMTTLGMFAALLSFTTNFQSDTSPLLIYILVSSVLRWVIVAVSYSYPLAGGILFIIDGSVLGWAVMNSHPFIGISLVLSFLLIICGVLFILSWQKYENTRN